jgi:hypothetical protein
MNPARASLSLPTLLVYAASLVLVTWVVVDVVRRPSSELSSTNEAVWIIVSVVGWLLFGVVGAFISAIYLIGPRRRMNAQRW